MRPDGHADDIDSVGYGIVEGSQHVRVEAGVLEVGVWARDGPADLVDREAGHGGASRGDPPGEAAEGGGVRDGSAGDSGGGVGAVAVAVAGREVRGGAVEGAVIGLVAFDVVSSAN